VRESLRLRPPIITLMRRVLRDTTYGGYDIPKDTLVAVSVAAANRLPEVYERADAYEPERFGEGRAEHKKSPFAFLSFGAGRHACIGETFGVLQTKTIYAWLLRTYELEYVGHEVKPDFTTMIVSPVPPCMVRYKRRK
jgi:sterol 14-demethylase